MRGAPITGFPPRVVSNGAIHSNDAPASQAHADAFTAYTTLVGEVPTANITVQDLGGMTLNPGIYHFNISAQLSGALVLNTAGNRTGTFIFPIGSTLTTASNSAVTFVGLAMPSRATDWSKTRQTHLLPGTGKPIREVHPRI